MPILWGKEWSVAKTLKEELVRIREEFSYHNDLLRELVELRRQELYIQEQIKK